jgi:serine/threonine-protein kinase
MAIIGVAVLVAIFGIFPKIFKPPPTATPTIDIQAPSRTSIALTPSQPSISGPTGTDTSTCIDREGIPMCLVPAGKFTMGNDNGTAEEQPVHTVDLDQVNIDKFEVTNAFYKACVEAGGCSPPKYAKSHTHASYYDNSEFEDYPVIYVDWKQATSYCKWRGARLPTEAEWEKAARGTDGRSYPWIEDPIDCSYANYADCEGDTTAVGSYEKGRSPYGIYDMAGNVREWVSSLYFPYPYSMTDGRENPDVTAGSRVLRGGAWTRSGRDGVRSTYRYKSGPDDNLDYVGFRCARDVD